MRSREWLNSVFCTEGRYRRGRVVGSPFSDGEVVLKGNTSFKLLGELLIFGAAWNGVGLCGRPITRLYVKRTMR